MALSCGFKDLVLLNKVCTDLSQGAVLGCKDPFRAPGKATNAPGAYEEGEKVTDAFADWVSKGFCYGPVPLFEVPDSAKFSGIMTRPKPNGSVRVIQNMSAPEGSSVNDGINASDFPTLMSSTTAFLRVINLSGRGGKMLKIDFSDAYKHIAVALADTDLQWFSWLGMGFKELCLVFGCTSSAGIFDRFAKIVLFIVLVRSGMPKELVCQHLDDVCGAAPASSSILEKFDQEFFEVAEYLGVKLAPRDDPDKSFGPSTSGVVLGVFYDTVDWTWSIKGEKLLRLLHQLREVLDSQEIRQDKIWTINGKILHFRPLIPTGRFNVNEIIKANSFSTNRAALVPVSDALKAQLWFWLTMLRVCDGRVSIPNPDEPMPPWTLEVYSDAAGGSWTKKGLGVGVVAPGWWAYVPWSKKINVGVLADHGKRLDRVMSAWELLGPLLALCAGVNFCRGRAVRVWVDNSGSVVIWKKGYSPRCPLSNVIVKAIATVAASIGCRFDIEEITRCSTPLAVMADALSKGNFPRFWREAYAQGGLGLPLEPLRVPLALRVWLENPVPSVDLGQLLLRELAVSGPVLGLVPGHV